MRSGLFVLRHGRPARAVLHDAHHGWLWHCALAPLGLVVRRVLLPRCQGLRRATVSLDWLFGGSLGFVGVNGIFGTVGLTLPRGGPSSGGSLSVSRPVVLPGRQGGNQVATSPGLVLLPAGAPGAAGGSAITH